jgi:dienelactone hydrolase
VKITDDRVQDGVRARRFELATEREPVPGMVWTPEGAEGPRPKVLFGHGGSQHKKVRNIVAMARALVLEHGYAAVAIDAVGHGDRVSEEERERGRQAAAERERARQRAAETGEPIQRQRTATGTYSKIFLDTVEDWVEVLDAVEALGDVGAGPTGWWGVSMGTGVGLPFVAREPRFTCAVFGLASASADNTRSPALAASIAIPVLFLAQANDGGHPVPDALRLWSALGSSEKTMHLNPGPHVGIPEFERRASVDFFARHLGPVAAPGR